MLRFVVLMLAVLCGIGFIGMVMGEPLQADDFQVLVQGPPVDAAASVSVSAYGYASGPYPLRGQSGGSAGTFSGGSTGTQATFSGGSTGTEASASSTVRLRAVPRFGLTPWGSRYRTQVFGPRYVVD